MIASPGVPSRIARKVIDERAVLTHYPVHTHHKQWRLS